MAQDTQIFGNTVSLDILSNIIEVSSSHTVMYGENGVTVVNTLTTKKPSLLSRLLKR